MDMKLNIVKNDDKNNNKLSQEDKEKIKSIIKSNFLSKPDFDSEKLTDDFINRELNIVVKHVKIKHSHHMDSLYSLENYYKIKIIVGKKFYFNNYKSFPIIT